MELVAIFSENRDECLEHYGVPGMKWGVRKPRITMGSKKAKTPKQESTRSIRRKMYAKSAGKALVRGAIVVGAGAGTYAVTRSPFAVRNVMIGTTLGVTAGMGRRDRKSAYKYYKKMATASAAQGNKRAAKEYKQKAQGCKDVYDVLYSANIDDDIK